MHVKRSIPRKNIRLRKEQPPPIVVATFGGTCKWCGKTYGKGARLAGAAGFDWVHYPKCYGEAKPLRTGLTNR